MRNSLCTSIGNALRTATAGGLVLAAIAHAGASTPIDQSDPALVNSNAFTDNAARDRSPSIASSPTGVVVVAWDTADDLGGAIPAGRNIVLARSVDDGQTWSDPVPITSAVPVSSGASIATDGEGVWILVFNSRIAPAGGSAGSDDIFFTVSLDDGATWSPAAPLDDAYAVQSNGQDTLPSIVSLGEGEWVVAWQSTTTLNFDGVAVGNDSDIFVSRTENNGAAWTSPRPMRLGYAAGVNGNDTEVRLAADADGRLVAVWTSTDDLQRFNETNIGNDQDILVARSSSRGISWTFPSPLNSFAAIDSNTDRLPSIATDRMGGWIVTWRSQYGGPGNIYNQDIDVWAAVSVKDGEIWSESSPIVPEYAQASNLGANDGAPKIGTDELGNWVIVWESERFLNDNGQPFIGADFDILYSVSSSLGDLWSYPAPLNTNAETDGNASDTSAAIAVDRSGRWVVAWASTNPDFGANNPNDDEILATTFLSPVVEVLWTTPAGGVFGNPANWDANRVPGLFDRAAFDDTLVPQMLNQTYSVTVNEEVLTGRLAVRTGQVTLNLQQPYHIDAASSEASQPPILVGEYPGVSDVALSLVNSLSGPGQDSLMTAEAATVARQPGSTGTLETLGESVALLLSRGPTVIGEAGQGTLRAEQGATMNILGDLILGEASGSEGTLVVRNTGSLIGFGGVGAVPANIVIGAEGSGVWAVGLPAQANQSPASMQSPGALVEAVTLADQPGSTGAISVAGAGALMSTISDRFVVGRQGDATMILEAGGRLDTNSTSLVGLSELPGSYARVDIRDPMSRWFETTQAINIGLQGHALLTLGNQGTIRTNSSVNVLPRGTLIGDARVVGPLQNTGVVRVGAPVPGEETPGAHGVLTIDGRYSQLGPASASQTSSGSLFLRIAGEQRGVDYDALDISGDAFLGGGLFVSIDPDYLAQGGPAIGQTFDLLDSIQRDPNQPTFDVAVVPGFTDNRLLRVDYVGGEVRLEVSTLGRVLGFAEPEGEETIAGTPAGLVIANFDRDPDNLPDVVVPVAGPVNILYILRNLGNNPVTNQWLGFEVLTRSLAGEPGDPVAIGVGDFSQNGDPNDVVIAFATETGGYARIYENIPGLPSIFNPVIGSFPTTETPRGLVVADINADALDDFVIVAYDEVGQSTIANLYSVFAQPGAAPQPASPLTLPGGGRPESVDAGDLDNDKDLLLGQVAEMDLAIADAGLNAIIVLRNDGAGGFAGEPILIPTGAPVKEVRIAEVNDDGFMDIVGLSAESGEALVVINRDKPGEFAPSVPVALGANPRSLVVADLGGSETTDLAVIADSPENPGERIIRTLRGEVTESAITFSDGPEFPIDSGAALLGVADLNGSTGPDLVVLGGPQGLRTDGFADALLNAECIGDADGDGVVAFADLNLVLSAFGQSGPDVPGDVDFNGVVNFADLNAVLGNFGQRCR